MTFDWRRVATKDPTNNWLTPWKKNYSRVLIGGKMTMAFYAW